jgi:hypothetical protein
VSEASRIARKAWRSDAVSICPNNFIVHVRLPYTEDVHLMKPTERKILNCEINHDFAHKKFVPDLEHGVSVKNTILNAVMQWGLRSNLHCLHPSLPNFTNERASSSKNVPQQCSEGATPCRVAKGSLHYQFILIEFNW